MTKTKKSSVVKSVTQALRKANAQREANTVISLQGKMTTNGKQLGKALIALRKKLEVTKGCKGWFSKFLKQEGINRRTAYYAIDKANGKTRKTKKSRKQSIRSQFIASLKGKSPEKVQEALVGVWSSCVDSWMAKVKAMTPQQAKTQLAAIDAALVELDRQMEKSVPKKPAASVKYAPAAAQRAQA